LTTALRSLARLVESGGNVVAFIPGYEQLYGDFDRRVECHVLQL